MTNVNRELLKNGIEDFGLTADDKTLDRFRMYRELLAEWNRKMNLTGIDDEKGT